MADRSESDRLAKETWLQRTIRRPEIGAFIVMIVIIVALAFASDGKAFNALGLKNNIKIIAQYGIIAIGAAMLMIAGEFDLSIGSMIGFAGMSMALMLKWGLPFGMGEATPFTAFLVTLVMTLALGWIIGTIVVRSGLSSFIVTLAFLFFLRGTTEVAFRLINQSTQVSGLPDFKEESWFANILGGEVFGWFYSAWFWIGQKMTAGVEFPTRLTNENINYLATLNINRRLEQWVTGFDARFLWFIVIAAIAYFVLSRTQLGNWIFATGDNKEAARANADDGWVRIHLRRCFWGNNCRSCGQCRVLHSRDRRRVVPGFPGRDLAGRRVRQRTHPQTYHGGDLNDGRSVSTR